MTELSPVDPFAMLRRRGLKEWRLVVTGNAPLTPMMRRISLTADDLDGFAPVPGQDLVLMLPDAQGALGRRHYTVRRFDAAARRIDIDAVLHGHGSPGTMWARNAKAGDGLVAFGPRGRNVIHPGADWRLFIGDETALPAILAMLETLDPGSRAVAAIEVATDEERQEAATAGDVAVEWLSRRGAPAEAVSPRLTGWLAGHTLPAGRGHVYLLGETGTIRRLRHDLLARGLAKEQIFGEGYWRPGRLGGHDHLEEH